MRVCVTGATGFIGFAARSPASAKKLNDLFAKLRLIDPEERDITFMGNSNPQVPLNDLNHMTRSTS
jgi:nucleoside-diphosphate-sugar epimerase